LIVLGLVLLTPNLARPEPKKAAIDPLLGRIMRSADKAARERGRADLMQEGEVRFYSQVAAFAARGEQSTVRVRMKLDATARQTLEAMGIKTYGRMEGFASASIPLARLREVADVEGIEMMQAMRVPRLELDVSKVETGATGVVTTYGANGQGTIYGSIDTGIDWHHQDFRNADGTTRIKYLWNQEDTCVGTPPPAPFNFGCLYTQAQINAALTGGPTITAPDADGHGTHTAGVGAGNGRGTGNGKPANTYVGFASQADLIVVKTVPEPGDTTCSNCYDISAAMDFIDAKATELGEPYAINLSLGSQYGAHDATDADEMTIDALIGAGKPGRMITKSGGNDRGNLIHISGTLTAGASKTHQLVIPSYTALPGTLNDTVAWTIWYDNADRYTVKISDPTTSPCGGTVLSAQLSTGGGTIDNNSASGNMIIDDTSSPNSSGVRFFDMEIDDQGAFNPCNGTWSVQVTANTVGASGHYEGWIWFNTFGSPPSMANWTPLSADQTDLLSIPGTSKNVTTVGAYTTKSRWVAADGLTYSWNPEPTNGTLATFSSQGPTKDGRLKPELTAPGFGVSSTLSVDATPLSSVDAPLEMPDTVHWILAGTSFASPTVAGICDQLLSINPHLDALQLRQILIATARVDSFVTPVPNNDWGWGKVGALGAANMLHALTVGGPSVMMDDAGLFTFIGTPGAQTYNVYRGLLSQKSATNFGTCFQPGLTGNSFSDASAPPLGNGYMYYLTAVTGGVEGSLGTMSNGATRPNNSPCP
jgi:subtilisin family serine protease